MKQAHRKKIVLVLLAIQVLFSGLGGHFQGPAAKTSFAAAFAYDPAAQQEQKPDIPWFKDQLGIAPQYQEQREGILGMSWAHFLTMVFLVAFFFGALSIYYLKTIKTRRILERLLREEEEGKNGGSH